jgi:uncharacterized protein
MTLLFQAVTIAGFAAAAIALHGQPSVKTLVPETGSSAAPVRDSLGGGSKVYRLDSTILGESRRVVIAAPPSFAASPDRQYPLVIVLDGESLFAPAWSAATFLAAAGHIPEAVFAGIPNTRRLRDLTPPGLSVSGSGLNMGGDRFLDFIEKELIPALAPQFRATGPVILLGHSSGGILVTYAAATRDRSRWVVAIDTPAHLGDGWLGKRLMERARRKSSSEAVRYVSLEARFAWEASEFEGIRKAAPESWMMHREKLAHESHESMTMLASYLGLRQIFSDFSAIGRPMTTAAKSFERYAMLEQAYGMKVVPAQPALALLVEDLIIEGNRNEAKQMLELYERTYGSQGRQAQDLRTQVQNAMQRPPLKETVADLLATPRPSASEGAAFIGLWEGQSQFEDNPPDNRVRLLLKVVDGKLEGEWTSYPAPGVELVNKLDYVRVTQSGKGIDAGYMNGMRPRGVIVHELLLQGDGDRLEGKFQMRGVDFQRPDGTSFPDIRMKLRRIR